MNTIQNIINKAAKELAMVTKSPDREARLLIAHTLNIPYEKVFFEAGLPLSIDEVNCFEGYLKRRLNHEPLSKIKNCREFWSLPFYVTENTLDPRPDSETLIEAVLASFTDKTQPLRILDLGTGTGCLLLSLLHEYTNAWGVGVDISEAASCVARENADRLQLIDRSVFMVGEWANALNTSFDVIISNPPYIGTNEVLPRDVLRYDPKIALFGGKDGLDCYRELAKQIPKVAHQGTMIFLEIGATQLKAIKSIFPYASLGFSAKDLAHKDRCFVFCIETMPVD